MDIRPITDRIAVAPQIQPGDVASLAADGYTAIVNNRPDGEDAGQPSGDAIRAAAESAGLAYTAIPITHAGFSLPQVDAMTAAIDASEGKLLAYCRSGTRSCNLWALAATKAGDEPDAIVAMGQAAGYDLTGIRPLLDQLGSAR
ncbi:TIGR01244 family sulfur transferase [Sphingomonas japonica]|uniref:Uncharacterized protein (TIGR01244 family) n=1 Tax=Sphingomonas japonica TaxID=511662 RepID=A0ABX0TYW5_9SPHN|nr:TIGR01244 family sulfur transferase [Sphingomonas japonica]NIJ23513.1 uncharacterized protein (TIGR01244 family) [Sphingomonas japonica]